MDPPPEEEIPNLKVSILRIYAKFPGMFGFRAE